MLRAWAGLGETAARALEDDGWLRESEGGQSPFRFHCKFMFGSSRASLPRALSNRLTSIWLSSPNLSAKTLEHYRGMASYNPGNIHTLRLSLTVSTHDAHHNPGTTSRFKTLPSTIIAHHTQQSNLSSYSSDAASQILRPDSMMVCNPHSSS